MIEVRVPKEINKYESKLIGPCTTRQVVCILVCAPFVLLTYNLARVYFPIDWAAISCIPFAAICVLFGWYKPYGMKFDVFLRSVFISTFIAPSNRKYVTENYFAQFIVTDNCVDEISSEESSDSVANQTDTEANKKQKEHRTKEKTVKKKKYVKSEKAIF